MFSPFPYLLFLGILAPAILRVAAGFFFLSLATRHSRTQERVRESLPLSYGIFRTITPYALVFFEGVVGIALLAGFFVQIAAGLGILFLLKSFFLRKRLPALFPLTPAEHLLLCAILLSLIFSGAGAFAFDLPL